MSTEPQYDAGFAQALINSIGEGVYATDAEGRLTYMNRRAEQLLGWDAQELMGRNVHEAIHHQDAQGRPLDERDCRLLAVTATGAEVAATSEVFTRRDGTVFPIAYSSAPIREGSAIVGAVVTFRDVTRQRAAEEERRRTSDTQAGIAETLQRSLLPSALPEIPGLQLAASFRPVGDGSLVGGDFYDAYAVPDGWWLAVGDVCGKGIDAAAVTGMTRWTLRGAAASGADAVTALGILNESLLRDFSGRYCTVSLAHVRPEQDGATVEIVCAGHPPPLLRRHDGSVQELYDPGTLLGVYEDIDLPVLSVRLTGGDGLLFYTDGLLDARREVGQPDEAPVEALAGCTHQSASAAVTYIEQATGVLHSERRRDDVALLAVWAGPATAVPAAGDPPPVGPGKPGRRERVGRNEARFRNLNERIEAGHPLPEEEIAFLCECGRLDCTEIVHARRSDYERVRSDARCFLILPGHEIGDTETVVTEEPGWAVVRKHEDIAVIAQESDPRRAD